MLLGFLADVWQWASSVPSGREFADALGKQCGAGGTQVIALGVGVDRQRHRRIGAFGSYEGLQAKIRIVTRHRSQLHLVHADTHPR